MVLLAITADTWIITGLGFGIVLLLLFCLVFILNFFGWSMQKIVAPREPKAAEEPKAKGQKPAANGAPSDAEKAAIAMALYKAHNDDELAAVAYALYLAHSKHDIPNSVLNLKRRTTAWNDKSIGMNNVGF